MRKNVLLIIALFIAALNLRPAINSIAPLLESMRADLGMSAAVASLLTSIPVLCMGLFSPFAVKAGGRFGIERVMGLSLLVIGVGTFLRLFTGSVPFLLLTALIAGIGIAVIGPLSSGFIKQHFPNNVPTMIAVYSVALTLGATLGSGLSTPLERAFHSWKGSLAFWAAAAFLAAIVWQLFVHTQIKPTARMASGKTQTNLPWKSGKAWMLTLSFGCMSMLFYSFTAWLPQIVEGMGYSKAYASTALTLFVAIQIPVSLILSLLLRKFPSRRLWLLVEASFELFGLLLLAFRVEPLVAAAFIGIGAGGLFTLNLLLPIDATSNPHEAASWSAMTQSVGYVIGATGPFLLGWIHDYTNSFTSAVLGMMGIVVLMMIVQFTATSRKLNPLRLAESH
ncbi:CynX/NimT family MFS transporter [Paenibacillus sp. NPDC058071]|uniref:MFS transporter n=1 Tax=Paenibacillus sp. NPDC058071 TaxID=3346326 RepID=UPI0036DB8408